MGLEAADTGQELIATLCRSARERLDGGQGELAAAFVAQFYAWVAPDDLAVREADDLVGAALSAWSLAQERRRGEVKLHVRNPDRERDGWSSTHTVVEVVSDDMPFLVDSVTMELNSQGFAIELLIHPVMRLQRDRAHHLSEVLPPTSREGHPESVMHVQVTRAGDENALERLRQSLRRVLEEVRLAVADWQPMLGRLQEAQEALKAGGTQAAGAQNLHEMAAFLGWLGSNNFTFLGYREYDLREAGQEAVLLARRESGLGILRRLRGDGQTRLSRRALSLAHTAQPLVLTKANSRSTIHRPAYLDYVGVKVFDDEGKLVGERRFLGLYTTRAYQSSVLEVPLLRQKVEAVLGRVAFPPDSHDAKALLDILESYPRDSLFQMDADDLFEVATGILALGERQRVRLFITRDPLRRFAECLVCMPRDRFNPENRLRVGEILLLAFGGQQLDWSVQLSESVVARVHYIVRCAEGIPAELDRHALEQKIVKATRAWSDELRAALIEAHGEERGWELHRRYAAAFPAGYRSEWSAAAAVDDVDLLEGLGAAGGARIRLYCLETGAGSSLRCKLYSNREIALSDVLPTFEHMGARVVDERPHRLALPGGEALWVYDFGLDSHTDHPERRRELFEEVFLAVLRRELEDDALGALVLEAGLSGRQLTVIRAIVRYLRQVGLPFSNSYVQRTIVAHPDVAAMLVELFGARFDPRRRDEGRAAALARSIEGAIDTVPSLDEDRILRSLLSVVMAILRTNHFTAEPRDWLALKLDPSMISALPRPRPQFEIYVYSPRVEGVHLRGGRVARGGLRWSERPEDFRTEVLSLMKAQMVKNALIVPVGSKGGFVVKQPPSGGREALLEEGIACYRAFLSGLLDLTDNIAQGKVVPAADVVRYDGDDPYLVVAADKGTASFSDIANDVSAAYGFWLGDAFASGGSHGYDHKQMGITARGAWESVKRHFRELGRDIDQTSFTVVGIGDMSGDVFGNGMLLSRHTKLVAAFNHLHIFIDPDPDPERSFQERRRLFGLPRSSWGDYDASLLSEGGGIYSRSDKRIALSPQAREALEVDAGELSPPELISAILRAPVDLLWNGGIGTYVKAEAESHTEVGDKANDALRVNGCALRCKVVGEGGNLGFTQRGRIEYAARGGLINTDAIDNAGGVNCSDHEVNIKILLDAMVAAGELSTEQRNALLAEMADAVAERVIYASYTQTQAMSLGLAQAVSMVDVHARLLRRLEQVAGLDRELEALPGDDALAERKAQDQGLLAPELAVVLAYCKIHLYRELVESGLPDDEHLEHDLERYFPPPLGPGGDGARLQTGEVPLDREVVRRRMRSHRLRREIIATVVANQLVDRAGTTFVFRLEEETGASAPQLARGFAVAREVFAMRRFWSAVEALDDQVEAAVQTEMLAEARKLVERATRWLVRAHAETLEIGAAVARFGGGVVVLRSALPGLLDGSDRESYEDRAHALGQAGVPRELGREVACMPSLPPVFDIVEIAETTGFQLATVTGVYFRLGSALELDWLRERILELPRSTRWQTLARAGLRDEVMSVHRRLAQQALGEVEGPPGAGDADPAARVARWREANAAAVERWLTMLGDIRSSRTYDTTTLPVALREVRSLLSAPRSAPLPGGL